MNNDLCPSSTPVTLIDPLENYLSYQLRRAAFATVSALENAYAELGLTATEAMVLRVAKCNPGCTQADISRMLGVKRTNLVPVVSGLMARGLLKRAPADGRSHSLYSTARGEECHRRLTDISNQHEQYFFGELSERARRELMQIFKGLRQRKSGV
jgi:DNA-binding MarR family transcriptional regulator